MQIFVNPNYQFVKHRWKGVAVSVVFVLAGLAAYFVNGVNWGIDFAGGASITLKFKDTPPLAELRNDLPDATIQQYGKPQDRALLIRLPKIGQETDYAGQTVERLRVKLNPESAAGKLDVNYYGADRLASLLQQADPDRKGTQPSAVLYYEQLAKKVIQHRSELGMFTSMQQVTSTEGVSPAVATLVNEKVFLGDFNVLNQETVGPRVGEELQTKAIWAIVLSSLAMGIYIWLRFRDLTFGLGAVVCIIHDVAIALAFLLIMKLEFSLNIVAALLTIVGYSINDTVVMYDRIRENKRKIKKPMSLGEHLDLSINQTLSRTILTSGSVFLVLVALIAFGGDVIRGFAWILMMGVISGTYSTLLIVPAVAVGFDKWMNKGKPVRATREEVPVRNEVPVRKRRAV
ncbi:MAG: SecD/SecF fusion protein [Acidobacteriota bacterium]|jgi:preprotein translocase subunit SecF|nr:SecD/SecF fusion protein [Acidobacteriota bacterium]